MKRILFTLAFILVFGVAFSQTTHKKGAVIQDSLRVEAFVRITDSLRAEGFLRVLDSLISEGVIRAKDGIQVGDSVLGSNNWVVDSIVFDAVGPVTDTAIYVNGNRIPLGLSAGPGGGGATAFTELTDAPNNYTDKNIFSLRVNAAGNAIEFFADVINPIGYGADPTGVADSYAAVQEALDTSASQGKPLVFTQGTYKINSPVTSDAFDQDHPCIIEGVGNVLLDFSDMNSTDIAFELECVVGGDSAILDDLTIGDTLVKTNLTNVDNGDVLEIFSTDPWAITAGIYKRELVIVRRVSNDTVFLYTPIFDSYDKTTTIIRRTNAGILHLRNFRMKGDSSYYQNAVTFRYFKDIHIQNVHLTDFNHIGFACYASMGGKIENVSVDGTLRDGFGYGITLQIIQNLTVQDSRIYGARHAIEMGLTTRMVNVKDCWVYAGTEYKYPLDNHESCEYVTFQNNYVYGGLYMRGLNCSVINNVFYLTKDGPTPMHINIYGYAPRKSKYHKFIGNTVITNGNMGAYGIRIQFWGNNDTIEDVIVANNNISTYAHAVYTSVENNANTGNYIGNFIFTDNSIENINPARSAMYLNDSITFKNVIINGGVWKSEGGGLAITGFQNSEKLIIDGATILSEGYPIVVSSGSFDDIIVRNSYLKGDDHVRLWGDGNVVFTGNVLDGLDNGGLDVGSRVDTLVYSENIRKNVTGAITNNASNSHIGVVYYNELQTTIDHNALANYDADEHIDWSITGVEDIHADRIQDNLIDHDDLLNSYAVDHINHTTIEIAGTKSLSGSGDLTGSIDIELDNDEESPGENERYSTNSGGVKGWQDTLYVGTGPDLAAILRITESDGVLRFYTPTRYYDIYAPVTGGDTTNVYFSQIGGNDANDGWTVETPKKSQSALEALYLDPGDSVFFNKGDTWRFLDHAAGGAEDPGIAMVWRGAEGNHITFTSYGSGDKPRILGSDIITTWVNHSGNIWKGYKASLEAFADARIYFENTDGTIEWGNFESTVSGIDALYDYRYSNDTIYMYSASNPTSAFTSVEIPQIQYVWMMETAGDSSEYITFDNLEIAYCEKIGIYNEWPGGITGQTRPLKGLEVRNCLIHHIGEKNGDVSNSAHINMSNVIFENNEVHNCGRRGLSINVDGSFKPDSVYNVLIQDNYFHDGWHTTGPDIDNSGDAGTVFDSIVVRRNIVEDNQTVALGNSNGMYFELNAAAAIYMQNVWVYNNLFKYSKGKGLLFNVNGHASNTFDDIYIHNNTFYDFNENVTNVGLIQLDSINGAYTDTYIRNNMVFTSIAGTRASEMYSWLGTGVTSDYNLYWVTHATNAFYYDETGYHVDQWAAYKTASGREGNSPIPADPLFKDPPDSLRVFSNSDAVGGGIDISGYTTDYEGVTVSSPPNIGAYENTAPGGTVYDPSNWYWSTSGNDALSGHHPDSAKQTIGELNNTVFSADDSIYFKFGEIFRGQISNPEDGASGQHVVFTTLSGFGAGDKSIITTAENESSTGDWTDQGGNIWWNSDAHFTVDVGNLIFQDGSIGKKESSVGAVNAQGDFFYDYLYDLIVMYSVGNPATFYTDIECAINTVIFQGDNADYITIDGLAFKWGGRHGIGWNTTSGNNITIKNCNIEYIGGCENYEGAGVQLGNGIEFYSGDYTDILVEKCYFNEIFDAAFTTQYPDAGEDLNNIYINGNIFVNVRYGLELAWDTDGEIHTFHFNNNTLWRDDDYVFGSANRWSGSFQAGFVTFYDAQNGSNTDVDIYNNIFYYENISGIYSAGVRYNFYPLPAHIDIDYNQYYSPDAFTGDHCLGNASGVEKYTLGSWQAASGSPDGNGYNSDPVFKSPITNFRVHSGSDAVDGGVAVAEYTTDYEGVAVGSPPNIGAIETTED